LRVLVACEFSGVVREAFREKGHEAYSCDILPSEQPTKYHIQDDVLKHLTEEWDLLIAFPPCTYLCVTGNKWMKPEFKERFPNRWQQRLDAIRFFKKFAEAPIDKICIENPVGIMSRIWRKPTQIIQPYYFGHSEPKKTCLWLKNLPFLKPTRGGDMPKYFKSKSGKNHAEWYHKPAPSEERTKMRERTFTGIAQAMANQWGVAA